MTDTGLAPTGGFQRDRYFSRAWALLTHDKGWIKPFLVMTVADLVPVAGPLGTHGYKLEWARLLSWGADVSPKQKNVQVGACIGSGWRGFLAFIGWAIVMGVIGGVCRSVPLLGGLLGTLWSVFSLYLYMVTRVAQVRATIYQKAGAGYKVKGIWDMCSRDANGLLRIIGSQLVCWILMAVVAGIAFTATALGALPRIIYMIEELGYYSYGYTSAYLASYIVEFILYLLEAFGPTLIALGLLGLFANTLLSMVVYASLGLWMRQFDVPNWGRSEDPLPPTAYAGEKGAPQDAPAPVMPVAPAASASAAAPVSVHVPVVPASASGEGEPPEPEVSDVAAAAPTTLAEVNADPVEPEYAPDGSEVVEVESVAQRPEEAQETPEDGSEQ